ncbi:hypothetical protein M2369_001105 [Bacillus sp. JUb11]|nr:hypothetical protein [Bacillus sp. JUb11]
MPLFFGSLVLRTCNNLFLKIYYIEKYIHLFYKKHNIPSNLPDNIFI